MLYRYRSIRKRMTYAVTHTPGLIGFWPLQEVEGTTHLNYAPGYKGLYDLSSTNSPSLGQPGRLGRSVDFNGSNQVMSSSTFPLNSHNVKTMLLLVNPDVANTVFSGYGVGTGRGIFVFNSSSEIHLEVTSSAGGSSGLRFRSPVNSISIGNWNMAGYSMKECVVADARVAGDADTYVNGVLQTKATTTVVSAAGANSVIAIGAARTGGSYYNGKLAYPAVFNRQLSDSEIRKIAHAGHFV